MSRTLQAVSLALLLAATLPASAQRGATNAAVASTEGLELVSDGANPVIRVGFAHGHGDMATGCFGYLYLSRETIRYEVVGVFGSTDRRDPFEFPRADFQTAQEWHFFGIDTGAAELRFRKGGKYHGLPATQEYVESGRKAGKQTYPGRDGRVVLPRQLLFDVALRFEEVVHQLEARQPPGVSPPATQAPAPAAAASPAASQPEVPAPPPRPATLKIAVQPGGVQVYLDNEPKGTTSADEGELVLRNLTAGDYLIRLSLAEFEDWTQKISLGSGQELRVEAKLLPRGPKPFTAQDVVELLQGGVSPKRVATLVRQRGVDFALNDEIEGRVRAAGGDAELLVAIAKAKK